MRTSANKGVEQEGGRKNLCFTSRYPMVTSRIGNRLNSANRKSLVFDGGKKPGNGGAGSKAFFYSL